MLPFRLLSAALATALLFSFPAAAQQPGSDFDVAVKAANAARDAGNVDEAIGDYNRALAIRPGWAEGWWELGAMQYEASHYADAVVSLKKLTELDPKTAAGWSVLGLSQFEAKKYSDALASLQTMQKLGGVSDAEIARVANYHLAMLLVRFGYFDEGLALMRTSFGESAPVQAQGVMGLALLHVPLIPDEVDPSKEALLVAAGTAAASGDVQKLGALAEQYPQTPWVHYAYGTALAAAGQTADALAQQRLETEVSPQNALPWVAISELSLHLNKTQDAVEAAKKAVDLDSDLAAAHEALAKALTAAHETQRAAVETRKAAQLAANAVPQRDPRMIVRYAAPGVTESGGDKATWDAAMKAFSAGQYAEAVTAMKSWVQQNPADGTAWAVMGLAEFSQKDYANARIHLQRGVDLGLKGSPESIQLANNRLATLMVRDGDFDAASRLLTPFAEHAPSAVAALADGTQLALGMALLRIPMLPEALSPEQHAMAADAGDIVRLLLASRYEEAFPKFQALIAAHPTTRWLHYAYGDALYSLSQYDEAKAQMQAELKLSPHSALPWIRLASIAIRQHEAAEALTDARTAVSADAGSVEAHYELGRAWMENGDAQKAIAELEKANGIRGDNAEIHFALAAAYAKAGQADKAAAERTEFLRLKALAGQP